MPTKLLMIFLYCFAALFTCTAFADPETDTTSNIRYAPMSEDGFSMGAATTDKIGFYGLTPLVQPSSAGETTGFTAGSGTAANDDSTFTGNVGSTAYTVGDIVKHLKNLGLIAQ